MTSTFVFVFPRKTSLLPSAVIYSDLFWHKVATPSLSSNHLVADLVLENIYSFTAPLTRVFGHFFVVRVEVLIRKRSKLSAHHNRPVPGYIAGGASPRYVNNTKAYFRRRHCSLSGPRPAILYI